MAALKENHGRSSKALPKPDASTPAQASRSSRTRKGNHLKNEVYREMLRLEVNRPGAEMGLALALLRAIVQSDFLTGEPEGVEWLKTICSVGLKLIEAALAERCTCGIEES